MKVSRIVSSIACMGLLCAAQCLADTRMIEVGAQFVRATQAQMTDALKLAGLDEAPAELLDAAQFETVKHGLRKGGCDFFGNLSAITKSGTRGVVNAVREVRYPAKYGQSEKDPARLVATAFETRNVGVELEFEATADPKGGVIDLTVSPRATDFLGFIDYSGADVARPDSAAPRLDDLLKAPLTEGGMWQPVFSTFKVLTTLAIGDGHTALVGGLTNPEPIGVPKGQPVPVATKSDQKVFVFVTAKIVKPN